MSIMLFYSWQFYLACLFVWRVLWIIYQLKFKWTRCCCHGLSVDGASSPIHRCGCLNLQCRTWDLLSDTVDRVIDQQDRRWRNASTRYHRINMFLLPTTTTYHGVDSNLNPRQHTVGDVLILVYTCCRTNVIDVLTLYIYFMDDVTF